MYMSVTSNAPILLDKFYNNNNKNSKVYIQIVSDTKYNNIVVIQVNLPHGSRYLRRMLLLFLLLLSFTLLLFNFYFILYFQYKYL